VPTLSNAESFISSANSTLGSELLGGIERREYLREKSNFYCLIGYFDFIYLLALYTNDKLSSIYFFRGKVLWALMDYFTHLKRVLHISPNYLYLTMYLYYSSFF